MMSRVLTPEDEQGWIAGFAFMPGSEDAEASFCCLVAIPGNRAGGKLRVYAYTDLKLLFVEPEVP